MDIKKFWKLIDDARETAGNWKEMFNPLVNSLLELDVSEIILWGQMFSEYQRLSYKEKLWAAAYVINGGCSDDGFDYFRGWLTAQGKNVFMLALKNPDSLADADSTEYASYEEMLGVDTAAYFKKLGIGHEYDKFSAEIGNYPLPEHIKKEMKDEIEYDKDIDTHWEEEGDTLKEILPKLCETFEW